MKQKDIEAKIKDLWEWVDNLTEEMEQVKDSLAHLYHQLEKACIQ